MTTAALSPLHGRLLALTRRLPDNWLGRRLAVLLRKPVLRGLREPIEVDVLGFHMRLHPFDNVCERRVLFTPQFFDPLEMATLQRLAKPGFCFVDLGANAGVYSLFVAHHSGNTARVLAVEPQPEMKARLLANIALNDFTIEVAGVAVADFDGTVRFGLSRSNRGEAGIATTDGESIEVPCQTLLSLLDAHGLAQVDAMKIDIEGVEDRILAAFFAAAPRARWPRLLFMENNPGRWQTDCLQLCLDQGYRVQAHGRMNYILELAHG